MSIWFFVMLILAVAMVLGPISMLRPNPAQRRKEQLRLHASKQGVRFNMRRLPALKTDMEQAAPMPVYYLPAKETQDVQEWILMRTSYVHEGNFHREWDWQSSARPNKAVCDLLKNYLPQLPASVPALSRGAVGTCVFWTEKEGMETLDMLIEMLTKLDQTSTPSIEQN